MRTSVALRGFLLSLKLHTKAAWVYFTGTYFYPLVCWQWLNGSFETVPENAACLARMTVMTVQVQVIRVKVYASFTLPPKSTKMTNSSPVSSAGSTERTDEWCLPYRHKLSCLPRSLLMSTASSIDLLVDLKEIQSQSPPVALFLLWEIKWLHSPGLSALTIIIPPSSPVVCSWFPLTVSLLHVYLDAKYLFRLFYKLAFVVPIQMWAEWRTAAMQIMITDQAEAGD